MARVNNFGKSENKLRPVWQSALTDHVIGLSWSPDGSRLAAASVGGPITVFEAATGKPANELAGHGFGTAAIAWQPGSSLIASAGQDGKARLWNGSTGEEVRALDAGAAWAERIAWHPSGEWLAVGAGKKSRVFSAVGELVRELPPQDGTVMDLAWRPGTKHLTVLAYGAATTFDPLAGADVVKLLAWKGSPLAMAWSPDGKILAHGNQDATIHFWYFDSANDLQMWGYRSKIRELAWDFSSRYLATGGSPIVCIWDCQAGPKGPEGSQPRMLEGHEENISALAYQARGRIFLWQPTNRKGPRVGEFTFPEGEATVLAWSPDDKSLAAGSGAGMVGVFRAG
jgi:WD40 repeat protein